MKTLTKIEFADLFGVDPASLPLECLSAIDAADFRYEEVLGAERESCFLQALKILDAELPIAGPDGIVRWEKGWQEILDDFRNSGLVVDKLAPQYFKYHLLRYRGNYIRTESIKFEEDFYRVVRYYLFRRYLADAPAITEFGCGTGTSLLMLAELYPDKKLTGCDWATPSQEILRELAVKTGGNLKGINFNMFKPKDAPLDRGTAVLTLAAMEQLGGDFNALLDYILAQSPSLCVHLEPLVELYDAENIFDYLAIRYHQKRNYLTGFLPRLKQLEQDGRITILELRRLNFGSFYNEGYNIVVWKS